MNEDAGYFFMRHREELAKAEATTDVRVRNVHQILAQKYLELTERTSGCKVCGDRIRYEL